MRLSEVMRALSYARTMTEGQPPGPCVRSGGIGMPHRAPDGPVDEEWTAGLVSVAQGYGLQQALRPPQCELSLTDDLSCLKRDLQMGGD